MVQDLHARIRHANLIHLGKAERYCNAVVRPFLPHAIPLIRNIPTRL